MPEDRIETLTRIFDGWARGDFSVGAEEFDDDATLAIDPQIPGADSFSGREERRAYMTAFLKPWKSLTMSAQAFEQAGDRVLVKVRQAGTSRETGQPVGIDYFQVWTFRGDSVIRVEATLSESRGRRMAGLTG